MKIYGIIYQIVVKYSYLLFCNKRKYLVRLKGEKLMIILAIIVISSIIIWSIYKRNKKKKIEILRIKNTWDIVSLKDSSNTDLEILREEYKTFLASNDGIDSLTWDDLEMDKVFLQMNFTSSIAGESYLYELLHKPNFEEEELEERNRVIEILTQSDSLRTRLQHNLSKIGSRCGRSLYDYLLNCEDLKAPQTWPHIICIILLFLSIGLIFIMRTVGILLFFLNLSFSLYLYFKDRVKIERDLPLIRIVGNMLIAANDLSKITDSNLMCYFEKIKFSQKLCKQFKRTIRAICSGVSIIASDIDLVSDYIRVLTHLDIILYNSYIKKLRASYQELILLYQIVGFLDSMVAVAKYRKNQLYFCTPNFTDTLSIVTKDIYHPLIQDAVTNDFTGARSTLITGSNASGKSTFLRTIGINALLAQTIYTVHATYFETNFFHIHTSISLKDDLEQQESYYMAEIKALKRIFDSAREGNKVLCLVDEVLKGTNTLERIAASTEILKDLLQFQVLCIAATHDMELTKLLSNIYKNMHFKEILTDNELQFDYRIKEGICPSGNAIKLLELMGFSSELIQNSKERISNFKEKGAWY